MQKSQVQIKKYISYALLIICVPLLIYIGNSVFKNKQYSFISLGITVIVCAAFFISFEYKQHSEIKVVLIAVLTALSITGRFIFIPLSGFKPVTAITIITAIYFGSQAGFMTGSLTALISNFYFSQGPWTPFQMLAWGTIGFLAGVFAPQLKKHRWFLIIFSAFSGVLFSFIMDIWTAIWLDNTFSWSRYAAALISSAKFTAVYAVSNVIFILVLFLPSQKIFERAIRKFNIN